MLDRLPLELIAQVVSFLDCFSIRDLLEASLSLRRVTVLVVCAKQPDPVQFFNIPHIRQVPFDEYMSQRWIQRAHLIKLFEVSTMERETAKWLTKCHTILDPLSFVHMDNSSFHDSLYITTKVPALKMAGLNGSKFVESWDKRGRYLPEDVDLVFYFDRRSYSSPWLYFSQLIDLSITLDVKVMELYGLSFPMLHSLSVRFPKSDVSPKMSYIFIPNIRVLSIHFSGAKVPLIHDINVGGVGRCRCGYLTPSSFPNFELEDHRSFELCHTEGFEYQKTHPSTSRPLLFDTVEYQDMNLEFTRMFERITLVGTPENLLRFVDPRSCRVFQYYRTIKYVERISARHLQDWGDNPACLRSSEYLVILVFKTSLENVRMPVVTNAALLEALVIYTSARGLRLHNLFNTLRSDPGYHSQIRHLRRLSIICDLPKEDIGGTGHLVLQDYDMSSLAEAPRLTSIHIDGCYFGENNSLLSRDYPRFGRHPTPNGHATPHGISLGLVRRQGTALGNDKLELNIFRSLVRLCQVGFLQVTQLTGSNKAFRPWKEISLPFATRHQRRGCRLRLSRDFERVFVDSNRLEHGLSNGPEQSISVWEVPSDESDELRVIN